MQADIRFEHQLLAVEAEHRVHCMLQLQAPPAPEGSARPSLHLALVIDRSGSMQGRKLEVTRECASFLVRRLAPTDQIALVDYDDEVRLLAPLAAVNSDALLHAISQIHAGGSTNLSGGWLKGVEELGRADGEGPRKVLLLTDGMANVGVVDPASLTAMTRKAVESSGVGTTTIGFGEGFSEDLLTAMADAGGGSAHFAETPDAAPAIFASEFEDLVALVAQNVSVEIRPTDDVQLLGVLNEFPSVPVAGGVQVSLGDAYGDERRRVLFELHIPQLAALGVKKVADVVLRYATVGQEVAMHETTIPLTVNLVSADEAAAAEADREVTDEVVILKAARAQEQAREAADRGEFDIARKLLSEAADEVLRTAPGSPQADELRATAEMLDESFASMEPRMYTTMARKKMRYGSRESQQRRKRPPQQA